MTKQRKPSLSQLLKQYIRIQQAKRRIWGEERKMDEMAAAADGCTGVVTSDGAVYRISARKVNFSGRLEVERLGDADELKEAIK